MRSSATAEDMPDASFAGQQETFLNVQGFDAVLRCRGSTCLLRCLTIAQSPIACIRVTITAAWRSPPGCRGWSAPIWPPPASCSPSIPNPALTGVVFITSAWGLGEMVVQGAVNPDEFYVHKPTLAAGRPAIVRRTMGSKKIRMVYAPTQEHGKQVRIEDKAAGAARYFLVKQRGGAGAGEAGGADREALRPSDGYRVGERWPHW